MHFDNRRWISVDELYPLTSVFAGLFRKFLLHSPPEDPGSSVTLPGPVGILYSSEFSCREGTSISLVQLGGLPLNKNNLISFFISFGFYVFHVTIPSHSWLHGI